MPCVLPCVRICTTAYGCHYVNKRSFLVSEFPVDFYMMYLFQKKIQNTNTQKKIRDCSDVMWRPCSLLWKVVPQPIWSPLCKKEIFHCSDPLRGGMDTFSILYQYDPTYVDTPTAIAAESSRWGFFPGSVFWQSILIISNRLPPCCCCRWFCSFRAQSVAPVAYHSWLRDVWFLREGLVWFLVYQSRPGHR